MMGLFRQPLVQMELVHRELVRDRLVLLGLLGLREVRVLLVL
jgi:hypothetical protein